MVSKRVFFLSFVGVVGMVLLFMNMYHAYRCTHAAEHRDFSENILGINSQNINNFDPSKYQSERLKIPSRDGIKVPVSLVYKKNVDLKKAPLLVYGYRIHYRYESVENYLSYQKVWSILKQSVIIL